MSKYFWLLALVAAPAAEAGAETPGAPRAIGPPTRIPYVQPAGPLGVPVNTAQIPREVRRAVVADAAKRFGVSANSVVLTSAEQVTWSDGSLGCPEPGQMYTQALVPGFRLVATSSAGALEYHSDGQGRVVTCIANAAPGPNPADKVVKPVEPRTEPPPSRTGPDR